MVLEERLLLEGRRRRGGHLGHPHRVRFLVGRRRDPPHVAGDQLQRRVPEPRAGAVVDRHPAGQVGLPVVGVDDRDVVGGPVHPVGQVRGLDLLRPRFRRVDRPDQRRPRDEVGRHLGQRDLPGLVEHDPVADPVDRGAVDGEQRRGNGARRQVLGLFDDLDRLADELLQQLLGRDQVVLVVLLEHRERAGGGEGLQVHRARVDRRGHVHEAQDRRPGAPGVELPGLADEREIDVVDRHRDAGTIGGGAVGEGRGLGRGRERSGEQREGSRNQRTQGETHGNTSGAAPYRAARRIRPARGRKVPGPV